MSSVPSDLLSLFPTGAPNGRSAEREPAPGFERQLSAASEQTQRDSLRGDRPERLSPDRKSDGTSGATSAAKSAADQEDSREDRSSEAADSGAADSEVSADRLDETTDDAAAGEVFVAYVQQDQNVNAEIEGTLGPISTDEVDSPAEGDSFEGEALEGAGNQQLAGEELTSELAGASTETLVTNTATSGEASLDGVDQPQLATDGAVTGSDAVETAPVAAALSDAQRAEAKRAATSDSDEQSEEASRIKVADLEQTGKSEQSSAGGEGAADRRDDQSGANSITEGPSPFQIEVTLGEGDASVKLPPITEELTESKSPRSDDRASPAAAPESAGSADRNDSSGPLERLAASRMQSARSETASEASSAPRVDASRFVSRVSRAVQTAQQQGGEIRLRLSPPELGSLHIKIHLSEGVMTATLETETASAKHALLDNLPALRDRLAEQEIRIERFDVDVRQEGRGGDSEDWRSADRESSGDGSHHDHNRSTESQTRDIKQQSPSPSSSLLGDGAINLIV